jgi:rhamnulokinase
MPAYLAVDLGAASGRVLRGDLLGNRLDVTEVHRFANRPMRRHDGLFWDLPGLYAEAVAGIAKGVGLGRGVRSLGVDAWGNDFGLLDGDGALMADVWHHRTPRTAGMISRLLDRFDADELYSVTGTQFLPITMACQLLAMRGSPELAGAQRLATVPDLFTYWLSGCAVTERTIASTSQLWDLRQGRWATGLIEQLGLPARLFAAELVDPGTVVGGLREFDAGGPAPAVVAVAGHDTACAVAAVPVDSTAFGYVSCGTWSLVGLETTEPITSRRAREAQFTNEAGVGGTVRFLSNVNGLWLLQECRRQWTSAGDSPSYPVLTERARRAAPFRSLIDPDDPTLLGAGDMPARIAALCRSVGEPVPADPGAVVRCILDSLACKYRLVLERGAALVGRTVEVIHLVGGGAANPLLCQLTADVGDRPVVAGPTEATGVGNLLVQAMAAGELDGLSDIRAVARASFPPRVYEPGGQRTAARDAYDRFVGLLNRQASAAGAAR